MSDKIINEFGFNPENKGKRNGGFLKDELAHIDIEAMFAPKLDEETASWFYGDETDLVNQTLKEMAERQTNAKIKGD